MAEPAAFSESKPLIAAFSSTPIPNLSLSAAGLLALADLHTVAQRTVITGGSSWLDAFVLAPGLQYQQAVDALNTNNKEPSLSAVLTSPKGGNETSYSINNAAMVQYIRRRWQEASHNGVLTLNIGVVKSGTAAEQMDSFKCGVYKLMTRQKPLHTEKKIEIDWLSHAFYLLSPVLTIIASTFMILLADWWGLAFIIALMTSRILNIYSIKQRSRPAQLPQIEKDDQGEYVIDLGNGSRILLRGLTSDIQAVTTQMWLRQQSIAESYFEAAAKLIVYLVAAFSGNQTQAGAMVLMALLITSAGLLGLSNAHAGGLQMNGRIARLQQMGHLAAAGEGDREQGTLNGRLFEDLPKDLLEGGEVGGHAA